MKERGSTGQWAPLPDRLVVPLYMLRAAVLAVLLVAVLRPRVPSSGPFEVVVLPVLRPVNSERR